MVPALRREAGPGALPGPDGEGANLVSAPIIGPASQIRLLSATKRDDARLPILVGTFRLLRGPRRAGGAAPVPMVAASQAGVSRADWCITNRADATSPARRLAPRDDDGEPPGDDRVSVRRVSGSTALSSAHAPDAGHSERAWCGVAGSPPVGSGPNVGLDEPTRLLARGVYLPHPLTG